MGVKCLHVCACVILGLVRWSEALAAARQVCVDDNEGGGRGWMGPSYLCGI